MIWVRYWAEVKKENVLGFVGRGRARQVVLYPELAQKDCPKCGGGEMECLQVCPTGVISNDFACPAPGGGPVPLVQPIRLIDPDNARAVAEAVGDREKGRK